MNCKQKINICLICTIKKTYGSEEAQETVTDIDRPLTVRLCFEENVRLYFVSMYLCMSNTRR